MDVKQNKGYLECPDPRGIVQGEADGEGKKSILQRVVKENKDVGE